MLFLNIDSAKLNLTVFLVVVCANIVGAIAKVKPIKNPILHTLHHVLYFLVIAVTSFSIVFYYLKDFVIVFHFFLFALMCILPFFKKGKKIHIVIGLSALVCSFIPVVNKYFN